MTNFSVYSPTVESSRCKTCADAVRTVLFLSMITTKKEKRTQVTPNQATRNSVAMDVSAARFKSQMICSNHNNKSHLVIFSALLYCVSFSSSAAVKEKGRQAEGAWLLSFNSRAILEITALDPAPAASPVSVCIPIWLH